MTQPSPGRLGLSSRFHTSAQLEPTPLSLLCSVWPSEVRPCIARLPQLVIYEQWVVFCPQTIYFLHPALLRAQGESGPDTIVMPNNLAIILILHHLTSWVKTSNSHTQGNSTLVYLQVEEQIREALETLNDCLGIRRVLESLPAADLHTDLQHLVQLQHAIICVLQIVEATALAVLQVFVDR